MKNIFLLVLLLLPYSLHAGIEIRQGDFTKNQPIKSWIEYQNDNLVRQQQDYSCGSASISTILSYYYDYKISEKEVLDWILKAKGITIDAENVQRDMVDITFLDLREYANSVGFRAVGITLDLDSLKNLKMPVIVYVKIRDIEHFSVYKGMDNEYVYLADPNFGNIKIRMEKFIDMFYSHKEATYQGRILALLPENPQNHTINEDFMNRSQHSDFIYEKIREKMYDK